MIEAARREARELDHGWIGVEHLLLALARGDSSAAEVLAQAGAGYEAARTWLAELKVDPDMAPPPSYYEGAPLSPRLERLAETVHTSDPCDWLVALLREPDGLAASALTTLAGGRRRVADALEAAGVQVPGELPPDTVFPDFGEPVYVPGERLADVVRAGSREIGVGFAFNRTRDGRGKVWAPRGVDLEAMVERVLRDA